MTKKLKQGLYSFKKPHWGGKMRNKKSDKEKIWIWKRVFYFLYFSMWGTNMHAS